MKPKEKNYRVYAALHEEAKEGWVWILSEKTFVSDFARIRNPQSGRSIICERRSIDDNFRDYYNSRSSTIKLPSAGNIIVMNAAIRNRLGNLPTQVDVPLEITDANGMFEKHIYAFLHHPNPAIRVGILLGVISVVLGFIGFALGVISLIK